MKKLMTGSVLAFALAASPAAFADDDKIIGGLLGAAIGATIGHQVDHRHGAIIGGTIGTAVGLGIASQNNRHGRQTDHYSEPPRGYGHGYAHGHKKHRHDRHCGYNDRHRPKHYGKHDYGHHHGRYQGHKQHGYDRPRKWHHSKPGGYRHDSHPRRDRHFNMASNGHDRRYH